MATNDDGEPRSAEESYVWAAGLDPGAILLDVTLTSCGWTGPECQADLDSRMENEVKGKGASRRSRSGVGGLWVGCWFVYELSTALVLSSLGCKPPVPTQPLGAASVAFASLRCSFAARAPYALHLFHLVSTRSPAHSFTRSAFKSIKGEECIGVVVVGSALFLPRQETERETEREEAKRVEEGRLPCPPPAWPAHTHRSRTDGGCSIGSPRRHFPPATPT